MKRDQGTESDCDLDEANILGPKSSGGHTSLECPKTLKGTVLALKLHRHFKRRRKSQAWWQTPEVPTVQEAKASLGKVRREREGRRKEGGKFRKSYNLLPSIEAKFCWSPSSALYFL